MYILGFDTSSGRTSVAISAKEDIIAYELESQAHTQAERLLPMIDEVIKKAAVKLEELAYIAVTIGPGSFTGIRVSLATARGLSMATNVPLIAVSNFELCYFRSKRQVVDIKYHIAVINAYRDQCYFQYIEHGQYSEPALLYKNELITTLGQLDGSKAVSGSYLPFCYDELITQKDVILLPRFAQPDAKNLCKTAYLKASGKMQDLYKPLPLYIRPPDAKLPQVKNNK